jgi:hypothetical protein
LIVITKAGEIRLDESLATYLLEKVLHSIRHGETDNPENSLTFYDNILIFFLELFPAIHCNLFLFKEKRKRISIAIWARAIVFIRKSLLTIKKKIKQSF